MTREQSSTTLTNDKSRCPMDNSSNPNWPNNPTSPSSLGGITPSANPNPLPSNANPTTFNNSSFPNPYPTPPTNPDLSSAPPISSTPVQPELTIPVAPFPAASTFPIPAPTDPNSIFNSPPPNPGNDLNLSAPPTPPVSLPPEPADIPTTNPLPTQQIPTIDQNPSASSFSSLDNPWNSPTQPPTLDGSTSSSSPPTWTETTSQPITPSIEEASPPEPPAQPNPTPNELAPTDLSHLLGNNSSENSQNSSGGGSETLVMPSSNSNAAPEVPNIPLEEHTGIPKWLIGVGIGLLIIVAGASAYFILGIGQPSKNPESVPAQVSKTNVKTPPPIATPIPQPSTEPAASGSANFGQLQGGGASASPTATSAADILKQRQQAR